MQRNCKWSSILLLFGLVAFTANVLWAQVIITSTIVGTVTDPNGAMVPGAQVTLNPSSETSKLVTDCRSLETFWRTGAAVAE